MRPRHSAANLAQATKDLLAAWQRTREQWQDAKAQEFADQYLTELPAHVNRSAAAAEALDDLLRKVRSDCA